MTAALLGVALVLSCAGREERASDPVGSTQKPSESTCPPGSLCGSVGETCTDGGYTCLCTNVCSGVEWAEGEEPTHFTWSCRSESCPDQVPEAGRSCRTEGLECPYGFCGGFHARCADGAWQVTESAPPP